MLRFKRLDRFMLQSFVPLFLMTFLICLFIVLMQFLWKNIDYLVGKGLGVDVLGELFFYAALTMVPMSLPLAVLLASLMTFGNLGERFELTALKASGISLTRTMAPLTALMIVVAIAAFFFQNNMLPIAQTKMWTLLYSVRQKSPELDIPEEEFYDQIEGFNLYVKEKNRDTGLLYDLLIYNVSKGGADNATIIFADSGKLSMTEDKSHLILSLWDGEQFENLKEQNGSSQSKNIPYRRESFTSKEVTITFDANFNRMDESGMRNQYVGKNMTELQATIDSVNARVDSIGRTYGKALIETRRFNLTPTITQYSDSGLVAVARPDIAMDRMINLDSLWNSALPSVRKNYINNALSKARASKQEYEFRAMSMEDDKKILRRHSIELVKKFTLSMACLVFFFIGAPLGAIIRKGGLGMPLVISVFLFIFYFIIDNTGYKMARDGHLPVWEGMWLSTFVLLPLGVFFTYKAVNDSAVFNPDAYRNIIRKLLGRAELRKLELRDMVMNEVEIGVGEQMIAHLDAECRQWLDRYGRIPGYWSLLTDGIDKPMLDHLRDTLEATVTYLSDSRSRLVILKLMELPVLRRLWLYHPFAKRWMGLVAAIIFPVGIIIYVAQRIALTQLNKEIQHIISADVELKTLLGVNTYADNDDNDINNQNG